MARPTRTAPRASAKTSPKAILREGAQIAIICQAWADPMGPRRNHIWNRVSYPARSGESWVPDAYVAGTAAANQYTSGIARCGGAAPPPSTSSQPSSAGDKAVNWMSAQSGSTRYDGRCLAAVYQAYLSAGKDIAAGLPYGPSHDSSFSFWTVAKNRRTDRNPPRGALVFFRSATDVPGHVAISLGGGKMITTHDGRTRGIHTMAISGYDPTRYLGWVEA